MKAMTRHPAFPILSAAAGCIFSAAAMVLFLQADNAGMVSPAQIEAPFQAQLMIPGLIPAESVLDRPTWIDGRSMMSWIEDPESGRLVVGYVFDRNGDIVHPDKPIDGELTLERLVADIFNTVMPQPPGAAVPIPEALMGDASQILEGMDETSRHDALRRLSTAMRDVENEAGFNRAAAEWLDELRRSAPSTP